ncbi:metallophosphoesterase family protein [Alkalibacillus almallahensis]|uniref:metallophosphoesterase family protein n=1 Tax=Alkalibacillus almallahensis TaxID=1379154 RepID=UPI001421844D|nr:DNA repair exonuclease [Alkalibacillus almallahensis]NIK12667.1 DNA repair exonuclease SbcCD nuclease subunit [Alkalibacillus almallahensis]
MKQPIRFIHTADLHLDSPFKGMREVPENILYDVQNATLKAFERLIELAVNEQVDFVVIVGDLFDVQSASLKSLVTLKRGLSQLNTYGINVYISFGNHDYDMMRKVDLTLPENTYIFPTEEVSVTTFRKGETEAHLYGFSYESRAVREPKVHEYERIDRSGYHIATLHGSLKSNEEHDQYAPFQLEDLKAKPFDYWALGHIHKRDLLAQRPYIVYPGNIQGRHMKETGEKGCYVVELTEQQTNLSFHSLHDVLFLDEQTTASSSDKIDDLVKVLADYKDQLRHQHGKVWLRLQVIVPDILQGYETELLQWLNEQENQASNWIWLTFLELKTSVSYDRNQLKQSNQFVGEVIKLSEEHDKNQVTTYLTDLLQHRQFKDHIGTFSDEELSDIQDQAEQLVINQLLNDRRD